MRKIRRLSAYLRCALNGHPFTIYVNSGGRWSRSCDCGTRTS